MKTEQRISCFATGRPGPKVWKFDGVARRPDGVTCIHIIMSTDAASLEPRARSTGMFAPPVRSREDLNASSSERSCERVSLRHRDDATPPTTARELRARWGRAVMASFFVVGAAISTAFDGQSWSRIASGSGSSLDWIHAIWAVVAILSGVVFALGRATVAIAMAWTTYCVIEAFAAYPFWMATPTVVADCAAGFLSRMAVAASLLLYITHAEAMP